MPSPSPYNKKSKKKRLHEGEATGSAEKTKAGSAKRTKAGGSSQVMGSVEVMDVESDHHSLTAEHGTSSQEQED